MTDPQAQTAAIQAAQAVLNAADNSAEENSAVTLAQADEAWSDGVLSAQHDLAAGEATAAAALTETAAGLDEQNAQATAQQYAADEMTMAHAQVAAWDASTTAGNTWNTATTLAATQFIAAGYSAQAAALSGLVSAMPTTPVAALGRDWAQYRAGLAGAESAWWSGFVPTVMTNTYLANLSASAYQAQVDAAYLSASGAASQADADYIVSQAVAGDNQAAADARADMAEAVATANATYSAQFSLAHDKERLLVSQAMGDGAYTLADQQADDAAAGAAYTLAVAVADAADAVAGAQNQYAAVTAAAESTASWTQAQDAATLAVTVAESQAYAAEQMNLAALAVSTSTQMGDSYAAAVGSFANLNPTPWAQQTAANAAAAATYNDHALLAWLAGQNKTLAAQSLMEIGTVGRRPSWPTRRRRPPWRARFPGRSSSWPPPACCNWGTWRRRRPFVSLGGALPPAPPPRP